MNIDLTPIFQAIIALLASLITYKLIPLIKSKTTANQQSNLAAAAKIAVYAAEQIFGDGKGDQKFEYARNALAGSGYNLSASALSDAIEKAVLELKIAWTPVIITEEEIEEPDTEPDAEEITEE